MSNHNRRLYEKLIVIIGSVYSGEDPGKGKPDAKWRTVIHPVSQAGLVFTFTLGTAIPYIAVLVALGEKDRIPLKWKFAALCIIYFSVWASFRLERLPELSENKLDQLTGDVGDANNISHWPPPHAEVRSQYAKVAPGVAVRVFALVAMSIIISCWLTLYSGGPFQSAYSQIIVAYPIFSTHVARRRLSLLLVYCFTLAAMIVTEFINKIYYTAYETQSTFWYGAITTLLLLMSAIVAFRTRRIARETKAVSSETEGSV